MVRRWLQVIVSAFILLLSISCGKEYSGGTASTPIRAQVVNFAGLNDEGNGTFRLSTKTFSTLTDLDNLGGKYLKIKRGGELKIRDIKGSLVAADSFSGGGNPKLRYRVKGGVVIARDYPTLAQLSAYYQFDHIFTEFDKILGFDLDEFESSSDKNFTAFFEPAITLKEDETSQSAVVKLNAAYVPGQRQFILFQRSAVEDVPLAANLQVIAHEFGHSLFDYSFYANKPDNDARFEQEYALSGINEGFADFISYRYTGSADVLRGSIDIKDLADQRNFLTTTFTYGDLRPPIDDDICSGSFYCVGTLFARSLVTAMKKIEDMNASDYTHAVIKALKSTQDAIKELGKLLPEDRVEEYKDLEDQSYSSFLYNGEVLSAFFHAFLQQVDSDIQAVLCPELVRNFGVDGFSPEAREGVCSL